jgi:hypothetical protein
VPAMGTARCVFIEQRGIHWNRLLRRAFGPMMYRNRLLRRMFGPKREELSGGWRKCVIGSLIMEGDILKCCLHGREGKR